MEWFEQFHFIRPLWLLALPVAAAWLWRHKQKKHHANNPWRKLVDNKLQDAVIQTSSTHSAAGFNWQLPLIASLLVISIISLAGPSFQERELPLFKSKLARVVVLDLSRSMLCDDLKPSRLERAKRKAQDLLSQLTDGETGMVVFAGEAFAISPLTDDSNTLIAQLPALTPNAIPVQGGVITHALQEASKLLRNAGHSDGDIIFLTDSTPDSTSLSFAQKLAGQGFVTSVIAFGTETAAPIPLGNKGYVKDSQGRIVIPKLNTAALINLANSGGGQFTNARFDDSDIAYFVNKKPALNQSLQEKMQQSGDRWEEAAIYLLPILALLGALLFRRGWLAPLVLLVAIQPNDAWAETSWWKNNNQQAAEQYKDNKFESAAELFTDPQWKADALYKAKKYQQAESLYKLDNSGTGDFNRGNALAQQGKFDAALEAYESALKKQPSLQSAIEKNSQLVKLAKQNKQPPPSQPGESEEKNNSQQQDAPDGEQQAGQQSQETEQETESDANSQQAENSQSEQSGEPSEETTEEAQQQANNSREQQEQAQQQNAEDQALGEASDDDQTEPTDLTKAIAENSNTEKNDELDQDKQARQQWLQRIHDDPAALWRNKFAHEYDQRQRVYSNKTNPQPVTPTETW